MNAAGSRIYALADKAGAGVMTVEMCGHSDG